MTKMTQAPVIAVLNQKGGVGKTTIAVNLAAALGTLGKRTIIIDLDAHCGATRCLGVPPESYQGTYEVLLGDEDPIAVALETDPDEGLDFPAGVSLIPANRDLERIDGELLRKHRLTVHRDCLRGPVDRVVASGRWDVVILDSAPNLNTPTAAAYRVADWCLLAATPERLAIEGLNDAMSDIETVRQLNNPKLRLLGVALSCVNKRTRLATEVVGWVEETFREAGRFGDFKTRISRSVAVPEAQKIGKTILQTEPEHKVTEGHDEAQPDTQNGEADEPEVLLNQNDRRRMSLSDTRRHAGRKSGAGGIRTPVPKQSIRRVYECIRFFTLASLNPKRHGFSKP